MNAIALYGFAAGVVATVNPCGFALPPAWFARQMVAYEDRPASERMLRAMLGGLAVSLGFITVFLLAGAVLDSDALWLRLVLADTMWLTGLRLPGLTPVES